MINEIKYGLKLWSSNYSWFPEAVERFRQNEFDFIELYVVPGSFDRKQLQILHQAGIPVHIHAPNEHLLNLGKEKAEHKLILNEVKQFVDLVNAKYIIIHPGIGNDGETILKNIKMIDDQRLVIENVPFASLLGQEKLYGYTFERMKELLKETGSSFCLDFTHAIKSA